MVEPVHKRLAIKFVKIVTEGSWSYPIEILRTKIELNDSLFSIGYLFTNEIDSFELDYLSLTPSFSNSSIATNIEFFASLNQKNYIRESYGLLDYLRDIGGLFGAFNAIFGTIVFILNFNGLYQLITSTMFRVQSLSDSSAA